ncbi:hypothetical protein GEU84_011355 [Fertoebacter nigrum]|uniref:Lipoprotein n=1 Tax=Fertoeibacter niger TaxID=2656921 RepID=A0A8X8KPD1_9RHOB|nr:hypothetical protein [Fertoeibacter niger]NUB44985.1 hypothetical protein [Fertoeibacter niger]
MTNLTPRSVFTKLRTYGGAGAVVAALGGCVSPGQQTVANTQQDQGVCSAMGANYGSPAHTQCMLQQQQRRDQEQLLLLEQARIAQETARLAQEMRENREN